MTDTIDTIKHKVIVSGVHACSLYTDTLTRLTRSFSQNRNFKIFFFIKKMILRVVKSHRVNRVIVSRGVFVPKLGGFTDTMNKNILVSTVSRGVFWTL